jgi:hypothetical protein
LRQLSIAAVFLAGCVSAPTVQAKPVGPTAAQISDVFRVIEDFTHSDCNIAHLPRKCTPAPQRTITAVVCKAGSEPDRVSCGFDVEWGDMKPRCVFEFLLFRGSWVGSADLISQCGPWTSKSDLVSKV